MASCCALTYFIDIGRGQNIVSSSAALFPANPAKLTDKDVSEFFSLSPDFGRPVANPEARRVAAKLERHVKQFLDGALFRPFHHTLGISGYEVYFDHPDEMFCSLAMALPYLSDATAARVKTHLAAELHSHPPYTVEGFDRRVGRARESYDVPESFRLAGRGRARSGFGVYAFWAWCQAANDAGATHSHWEAVRRRMTALLEAEYGFDLNARAAGRAEAEKLNGDLAGLLGLARLARANGDGATEARARARGAQLLELRVNLERVNPNILEKSDSATKSLHNFKLGRYCVLMPEVGEALHRWSEGRGAAHLKAFREERNAWYLAFGDRMIGGENYTNPLHFPRSLFAGATWVEQLPAERLLACVDVPWCPGDFYFIEKCVFALWAGAGRPWTRLP